MVILEIIYYSTPTMFYSNNDWIKNHIIIFKKLLEAENTYLLKIILWVLKFIFGIFLSVHVFFFYNKLWNYTSYSTF